MSSCSLHAQSELCVKSLRFFLPHFIYTLAIVQRFPKCGAETPQGKGVELQPEAGLRVKN